MNYQETIDWMFHQLPMYQTQGASAFRKDLKNTLLLSNFLNNPEKKLKCIHVAGTNGKGSTSHFLASILQEAGYKVGLFTSPHLKDFRERIKINGKEISKDFVVNFINTNKLFFEENNLSFFEMTVGLAFDYFEKEKTDINIIEVGLGGRLDSTNIITPLVSVITNIGFDHTQFLGNTIESIAFEKAGIIKNNIPVVIGEYTKETKKVFLDKSFECNSQIFFASDLIVNTYPSSLLGDYQEKNIKTVIQTIDVLNAEYGFGVSVDEIKKGLINVVTNTGLKGRWQILNNSPFTVCDTAHNIDGFKIILKQIQKHDFVNLHMVLGFVSDKSIDDILSILPKNAKYYFCRPNNLRSLDENILMTKSLSYGLKGDVYNSVTNAYHEAINSALKSDFIYVGGSNFVVAEII
ncbi:bifunctional folylpolyglutamate synthase/dihydrofolate synthase [Flavobacterium capsici]|uniref:Dihydrofolate synthase/folylpolyglutamate synthase n=1 Tax=Flavobacterium capsici TaxID=3075618 RepID=A0AA96J692_9FLAO|nr:MULTISPECIES: Mur ligase family protein [unclassified Flavobacterium]WNM20396.1 Mur ligase family protein [Flavobacterium sp. PMR2A8]WNM23160.1 Mur ligase family protein [Flavobacterium sp. PMTSA4]